MQMQELALKKKSMPYIDDLEIGTGRKPSRAGSSTRLKILDSAERLFADRGYDGTSLRDIADESESHLALSTYHFGTKEQLFDEVIRRRAIKLEEQRLANLARIDPKAQPTSETVRLMIEAYVMPMIEARYGRSKQWQAYVRLMASLVNVARWTPLIRSHYDQCAQVYIERWREVLPHAKLDSMLNAFSFMVVMTVYACSNTNRFEKWKRKRSKASELEGLKTDLVDFVHAGFMTL